MSKCGRLPDFIVVGSVKCGTTSLHYYLSQHPDVHVSRPKELNFFMGEEAATPTMPISKGTNWGRGINWYRSHFVTTKRVCGEISPGYVQANWLPLVVERMRLIIPEARILLLVREPLDRLWSHYLMERLNATSAPETFAEFVADPRYAVFRYFSDYGSQLKTILEYYPKASIHVVESAALDHDRERTLREIFQFLGVDPEFRSPAFQRRVFEGKRRRFPSTTGVRILQSSWLSTSKRLLPFTVYETLRNLALLPFSTAAPSRDLPAAVRQKLLEHFRQEVTLARQLSGLPLTSLEI